MSELHGSVQHILTNADGNTYIFVRFAIEDFRLLPHPMRAVLIHEPNGTYLTDVYCSGYGWTMCRSGDCVKVTFEDGFEYYVDQFDIEQVIEHQPIIQYGLRLLDRVHVFTFDGLYCETTNIDNFIMNNPAPNKHELVGYSCVDNFIESSRQSYMLENHVFIKA